MDFYSIYSTWKCYLKVSYRNSEISNGNTHLNIFNTFTHTLYTLYTLYIIHYTHYTRYTLYIIHIIPLYTFLNFEVINGLIFFSHYNKIWKNMKRM